jgi:hypothetical protein
MATRSWYALINFIAFIAIVFVAAALLVSGIFEGRNADIAWALKLIADVLSYLVVAFCSFIYATNKWGRKGSNIWYLIVWIVAIVLITIYYGMWGFVRG